MTRFTRADVRAGAALLFFLLAVYNANGREIGSYDTRPTELAARELVLRGTLGLNHVVGATPEYARRWGIELARDGRYRAIYSPVPAIEAAALAWPWWKLGVFDINAPLAPRLMAVATASLLVALAVLAGYATARLWLSIPGALLVAAGLGLGTGLWSGASQTLWQSETVVLGMAAASFVLCRFDRASPRVVALFAAALALALLSRPQLTVAAAVLSAGAWRRWGPRPAIAILALVGVALAPLVVLNLRWWGHPLGALALLEGTNSSLHGTGRTFGWHPDAWAGLLVSPSRGLLVFSPVTLVALLGFPAAIRGGWRGPLLWCAAAIAAHYALFSCYAVWWGGHTFGPRDLVDVLPLSVPLAAAGLATVRLPPVGRAVAVLALAWSIAVAAIGAFCYPHDAWNSDPTDIDRDHARLWSWSDNQIRRAWQAGLSPQNFSLFTRAAIAVPRDAPP
jgi:hypothetical protein